MVCGQRSFVEFVGERCKEMVLVQTFDHTCGSDWCILHADTVIKALVGGTWGGGDSVGVGRGMSRDVETR